MCDNCSCRTIPWSQIRYLSSERQSQKMCHISVEITAVTSTLLVINVLRSLAGFGTSVNARVAFSFQDPCVVILLKEIARLRGRCNSADRSELRRSLLLKAVWAFAASHVTKPDAVSSKTLQDQVARERSRRDRLC